VISERERVYASPGGVPLRYDLFRPASDVKAPLIVCVHGGGWISGEPAHMHEIAATFAEHGFAAACPQYRLAPLHPFPAAIEDVQEFVRFARSHADDWKIRPDRIGAIGISAGAHLALMLGLAGEADSRVQAVVDICGITDITNPRESHYDIAHSFLFQFMGLPPEGNEETYRQASPLHHVSPDDAPILVIHGEDDDVVSISQSDKLVEALKQAGVPHDYKRLPGELHAFSLDAYLNIVDWSIAFLREKLA
jgi:acetyl esterase/lipase